MRRGGATLLILLVGGCRPAPSSGPIEGAIASDLPASRAAGERILQAGGSAVDAAIASLLAQEVENPANSGLGGGGFAVVWEAGRGTGYTLDFRETAPVSSLPDRYLGSDGKPSAEKSRSGCLSIGVPGALAGFVALHARFGRLSWREVVEPARRLAEEGVPVVPYFALLSRQYQRTLASDPVTSAAFLHEDGTPYTPGEVRRDPDLARTLATIEDDLGESFYRGSIAAAIAAVCRDQPGLTRADLAGYRPVWRSPLAFRWRGFDLLTMGPPSSGGALLGEMLHVLEPATPPPRGAASWHVLAETMKHAFADRAGLFGDPAFVDVPLQKLLSPDYATWIRSKIGRNALPPAAYGSGNPEAPDHGTTHVSAIDSYGNAAAITNSVNGPFGSGLRVPRAGIMLNNTVDDFSFGTSSNLFALTGSARNAVAPGKRPVSSMTPVVALQRGRVRLVAGGSGGPRILTGTFQAVLGVLAEGLPVQEAVNHPRIHDQWEPAVVLYEPGVPTQILQDLRSRGDELKEDPLLGVVDAVELNPGATRAVAAVDHRKDP